MNFPGFWFCFDLPKTGRSAADFYRISAHFVNKNLEFSNLNSSAVIEKIISFLVQQIQYQPSEDYLLPLSPHFDELFHQGPSQILAHKVNEWRYQKMEETIENKCNV